VTYTIQSCNSTLEAISNIRLFISFYNSSQCWATHEKSVALVTALVNYIKAGDWPNALPLIFPATGASADAIRLCCMNQSKSSFLSNYFSYPNFNFLEEVSSANNLSQCVKDIVQVVQFVPELVGDIRTMNFSKLIADGKTAASLIKTTISDCRSESYDVKSFLNLTTLNNTKTCIADIKSAVGVVTTIVDLINKGYFPSALAQIPALIKVVQQAIVDCSSVARTFRPVNLVNFYPSQQCFDNIQNVKTTLGVMQISLLFNDKESFQTAVPEMATAIKNELESCHRKRTIF